MLRHFPEGDAAGHPGRRHRHPVRGQTHDGCDEVEAVSGRKAQAGGSLAHPAAADEVAGILQRRPMAARPAGRDLITTQVVKNDASRDSITACFVLRRRLTSEPASCTRIGRRGANGLHRLRPSRTAGGSSTMTCPNCGSSRLKHKDERMKETSHMAAHHAGHPGIVLAVGVKGSNGWP